MKFISIFMGKIAAFLCKLIGRGSTFPGIVSQKIDKNILKKFKLPDKVIIVTGSSGKGSTTKIIAETFKDFGYKAIYNKEGGNMAPGIISTLLKNSSLCGKVKADVVVLETDERSMKYVTPHIKVTDIIITNVTRDQPPRQGHFDLVTDELLKGINDNVTLYLNANDPYLQKFTNDNNKIIYYGIEKLKTSYTDKLFSVTNSTRCPICNNVLLYDYYHIEDIGKYKCSNKKCKFISPKEKYLITDLKDHVITINNKYNISLNNDMLYNFYNTLAAFSILSEYDLDKEKISKYISKLNSNNKIYNKYRVKNRDVYVMNNKCENSSTYNQSMLYTYNDKRDKTIILGWMEISRRYLWDDVSWLYDIEFELLKENTSCFICAGPQRYDLAVRLKYAGVDEKLIKIHKDLYESKEDIKNSKGPIYAILNFDYLNDFNTVMEGLKNED